MVIYLIRHSMTEGNLEKRYIGGRTDEPLCAQGEAFLKGRSYPEIERLYTSPMLRCRQTAGILYPKLEQHPVEALRECDFGIFENKNYLELSDCPEYQQWVDSGGTLTFPDGENPEAFKKRSVEGFVQVLAECKAAGVQCAALVVHGGTIMSIMERYARPQGSYYDYQVRNGEGYELIVEDADSGDAWICPGSADRRSEMAVSSGETDRTSDCENRTNYKKLEFGQ